MGGGSGSSGYEFEDGIILVFVVMDGLVMMEMVC